MNRNHAAVYKIEHIASQRVYVGSTRNVRRRWNHHRHGLRKGAHHCAYLQRAWSKYGEAAFVFEIIESCAADSALLQQREQYWLDTLKPAFNTLPAAFTSVGFKMPREAVERHRMQITGRKLSPEHAAKARVAALGKKNRPETIEKKRQGGLLRGMPRSAIDNSAAARRGKKLSAEHIAKVIAARAGYKHSAEALAKIRSARGDPAMRERVAAKLRGRKQTPEHRERRRQALLAYYQRKRLGCAVAP